MIKETTPAIIAENIPGELAERPQWVCWLYLDREDHVTKVPCTPSTKRSVAFASSTDPAAWASFEDAYDAYVRGEPPYDGIGFVFSDDDPYCGIDLDKCRNPETGDIAPWAQEILERFGDAYVEVSPSGTGIHVIACGRVRNGGIRRGPVEMYSRGRYFTISGHTL